MWLVTVSNESDFEWLATALSTENRPAFELITTGSGGRVARSLDAKPRFHMALVSDDPLATRNVLVWTHREWHTRVFVSSGSVLSTGEGWDPLNPLIPRTGYRSAGRFDLDGGSPVLYEDIPFDGALQKQLADLFLQNASLERTGLFCATKPVTSSEARAWLGSRLTCQGVDAHTGEILLAGRHLGVSVACLKALAGPTAREVLLRCLRTLQRGR